METALDAEPASRPDRETQGRLFFFYDPPGDSKASGAGPDTLKKHRFDIAGIVRQFEQPFQVRVHPLQDLADFLIDLRFQFRLFWAHRRLPTLWRATVNPGVGAESNREVPSIAIPNPSSPMALPRNIGCARCPDSFLADFRGFQRFPSVPMIGDRTEARDGLSLREAVARSKSKRKSGSFTRRGSGRSRADSAFHILTCRSFSRAIFHAHVS